MVDYILIIGAILAIIIIVLVIKLVHSLVKAFIYIAIIFVILAAAFSFMAFTDLREISSTISSEPSTYILQEEGEFLNGFIMTGKNFSTARALTGNEIDNIQTKYEEGSIERNRTSMLFIFSTEAFPKDEKSEGLIEFLKEQERAELIDKISDVDTTPEAFTALVIYGLKSDPLYLIKTYRSGDLEVYPQTFIFRLMRYSKEDR